MDRNLARRRGVSPETVGFFDSEEELIDTLKSFGWKEKKDSYSVSHLSLEGCPVRISVWEGYVSMADFSGDGEERSRGFCPIGEVLMINGSLIVGSSVEI